MSVLTAPGMVRRTGRPRRLREDERLDVLRARGWEPLGLIARGNAELGVSVHGCRRRVASEASGTSTVVTAEAGVVVVKLVPRAFMDPSDAQALAGEIALLRSLGEAGGHPRVMAFLQTSSDRDVEFLELEALLGGPLHRHLRAAPGGRLPPQTALFYLAQIVLAALFLHDRHVVHRDIKASNVVLDRCGHAKLVDFGFAKALPACTASPAARARTFLGTAHALAPEMLARSGHDLPVDWWAVGVLGWEMLVGEPPFGYGSHDTGGQAGLFERIRAGLNPALIALVHTNAGVDVADLLTRLLDSDPALRLGSNRTEVTRHRAWVDLLNSVSPEAPQAAWEMLERGTAPAPAFNQTAGHLELLGEETAIPAAAATAVGSL